MANKKPLHLLIKQGSKIILYDIDNYKSINIQWNETTQHFLISFKSYGKAMLIGCFHFNLMGKVGYSYDK